jgi:branched-chain amino acid:cation transporter, LIVCS family
MKLKTALAVVIPTGFALFSMFFGSGNLVFPLKVGVISDGQHFAAAIGLILTAVVVPSLGAFVIFLYKGSYNAFFSSMGLRAEKWFPLLALSIMGPFGVLPRCMTVAQGSFDKVYPGVPALAFMLFACLLIFLLSIRHSLIIPILGRGLTPALLISLGFILFKALNSVDPSHEMLTSATAAFKEGFFQGYQTMDLLAAFFFSSFVIRSLEKKAGESRESSLELFSISCLIGMGLLALVYYTMVCLGGLYSDKLIDVEPQQLLGVIAIEVLGDKGGIFVCVAVILACLTTAIVLTTLFADHIRFDLSQGKMNKYVSLYITLGIAFLVSTLNFSGIALFIGPILEVLYPVLIVVSLHLSLVKLGYMNEIRWLFPSATLISLGAHLLGF